MSVNQLHQSIIPGNTTNFRLLAYLPTHLREYFCGTSGSHLIISKPGCAKNNSIKRMCFQRDQTLVRDYAIIFNYINPAVYYQEIKKVIIAERGGIATSKGINQEVYFQCYILHETACMAQLQYSFKLRFQKYTTNGLIVSFC